MPMQAPPPPAKGMDPRSYYITLVNQGYSNDQAYQAVQASFGPPRSPDDVKKDQEKKNTRDTIAAGAGMVGGAIAGKIIVDEAGKYWNILTGKEVPAETAKKFLESGSIGITRSVPAETLDLDALGNTSAPTGGGAPPAPKLLEVKGDVATIELPGGKIDTIPKDALNDSGFMKDINWGKVGQGAVGALQLYQAYNMAKDKNYVGAGIYGAGGTANIAASGLAGTAAKQTASEALGGYLMPGVNIALGGYGAYQTAKATGAMAAGKQRDVASAIGGASSGLALGLGAAGAAALAGAQLGSWAGPIGMAAGAAAGYLGSKAFGSKKGKAQFMRDSVRGVLQEGGILDDKFQGTLADGSTYDFGKDGSTLKWKNIDKIAAAQPSAWGGAVPLADALAASYGFVGQKASDISAWYAKGAVSNAGDDASIAQKNMQHFAQQQGITYDLVKQKLDEAIKDNRINQSQYDYYLGGARQLTAGVKPQQPSSVSTKKPAPMPPTAPTGPIETPKKKMSVGDVLRSNMK